MMYLCPFCGNQLDRELRNGIADCCHCHRVFDSCKYNQLSSAGWVLQKNPHVDLDRFIHMTKLCREDAILVFAFIVDNCYSHEEFQKYLRSLGLPKKIACEVEATALSSG